MEGIIINILIIAVIFYIIQKCAGWNASWLGWVMVLAGAVTGKILISKIDLKSYTENELLIGLICSIAVTIALAALICRDKEEEEGEEAEQYLINILMGNKETAERLIMYELQRNPNASREECVIAAIERLQSDRGR